VVSGVMAMSKKRQNYMHKASTDFQKWVRLRDGACQAAGEVDLECKGHLQAAHVIGRGELSVRLDPDNCIGLCQAHHMFYTNRAGQWHEFIERKYPGRWGELVEKVKAHRESKEKIDWKWQARYWRERVRQQEADV